MEKLKRYNAAIYCRLSKDDDLRSGESSSISTQKLMLEKYVKDNNWTIVDYYIDEHVIIGTSGENLVKSRVSALVPFQFFCKGKYSFI